MYLFGIAIWPQILWGSFHKGCKLRFLHTERNTNCYRKLSEECLKNMNVLWLYIAIRNYFQSMWNVVASEKSILLCKISINYFVAPGEMLKNNDFKSKYLFWRNMFAMQIIFSFVRFTLLYLSDFVFSRIIMRCTILQ